MSFKTVIVVKALTFEQVLSTAAVATAIAAATIAIAATAIAAATTPPPALT